MSEGKLITILLILPLTAKIFVQCQGSVSKTTATTKTQTVNNYKLSTIAYNMLREKNPQEEYANRFSIPVQTEKNTGRTPPFRDTLPDECDYLAKYCSRTYLTSEVCGRSLQYQYQSFKNYCLLDFVNCREGLEMWQLLHMGKCYTYKDITDYKHFQYEDDAFLSKDYVIDKHQWKLKDMPRYVQEKYNWE